MRIYITFTTVIVTHAEEFVIQPSQYILFEHMLSLGCRGAEDPASGSSFSWPGGGQISEEVS